MVEPVSSLGADIRLAGTLRRLAAELMRVTAGAGNANNVPSYLIDAFDALFDYQEDNNHRPSAAFIKNALDPHDSRQDLDETYLQARLREIADGQANPTEMAWTEAKKEVCKGALRSVASAMLDQPTQKAHGESLMFKGIRDLTEIRISQRKKA